MEGIKDKHPYYKLTADKIVWKGDSIGWEMHNVVERIDVGWKEDIIETTKMNRVMGFAPDVLEEKVMFKETMITRHLRTYIKDEVQRGGLQLDFFYVELYRRTAYPVGTLILTIIAVALTSRKSRGGLGLHIVMGLALGFTYIGLQQFTATFATKGNLNPLLACWTPNIIFGGVAMLLLIRAPK